MFKSPLEVVVQPATTNEQETSSTGHGQQNLTAHNSYASDTDTKVGHPQPPGHGESAIPVDREEEEKENEFEDWESDPDNPRNWPSSKKWQCAAVVSLYTFVPPLASSMMAPGLPEVAEKYNVQSPTIIALTLVMFLLSFALAPLVLAPISEMYGRTWVYHIANLFSLGFSLGCAFSPTVGALIGFRFLSGLSGAAPIALGGGSISDMFSEKDRASAMAIYSLGPLIGPAVGPIAGGFIAESIGIKWVFIVIAVLTAIASVVGIPLLKETYAPIIRLRRAKKQRGSDPEKAVKEGYHPSLEHTSKLGYLWLNLIRPVILITRSIVCFMLSLYMAFMYGIYYLMFATFADLFHNIYGFSVGIGGLVYLGLGIGFLSATIFGAKFADQMYHALAKKNNGHGTPEMRIPALIIGSLFVPVGIFWYGWSAQAQIHWIMPIIGTGIFAFGMMTTFLPIQLYLVDTFTYAASAVSAASVFRSLLGFAFPLFADKMFNALGIGGGNSLLGGLAIVLGIPFPVWLYYNGAALRARSNLSRK